MNNLTFTKISIIVFGVLIAATLLLGTLVLFQKPHVRSVEILGGNETAKIENQRIEIVFSEPMYDATEQNPDFVKEFISITPEISYRVAWVGSSLFILPEETLNSNSSYTIEIDGDLENIYQEKIGTTFSYEFNTQELEIAYIQKNNIDENDTPETQDALILTDLTGNAEEIIYTANTIRNYAIYQEFAAIVTADSLNAQNIVFKNLEKNSEKTLFKEPKIIKDVLFAPKRDELLLLVQDIKIDTSLQVAIPQQGAILFRYSLTEKELEPVDLGERFKDLDSFAIAPDGYTLLIKDITDSNYYLTNIDNPEETTPLGRFVSFNEFSDDGSEILFVSLDFLDLTNFPFITKINSDLDNIPLTDGSESALDPTFIDDNDTILYALRKTQIEGTKGLFKLVIQNSEGEIIKEIEDETNSLELPNVSPDDNFILMEQYDPLAIADLLNSRLVHLQPRPNKATIMLYNRETESFREIGNGIEAKWVY